MLAAAVDRSVEAGQRNESIDEQLRAATPGEGSFLPNNFITE